MLKSIIEAPQPSLGQCMFLHKEMRNAVAAAMDEESAGIFTKGAEEIFASCEPLIEKHMQNMEEALMKINPNAE